MERLRLGLIGTGYFVRQRHLPALAQLADRYGITMVCSERGASAAAVSAALPSRPRVARDFREVLMSPEVDVVLVAVPIHRTAPIVREALLAGKPVISEKPIAETVAQAAELLRLAAERGVPHFVAENFRYQGRFLAGRALLEAGRIGRPIVYDFAVLSRMTPDNPYAGSVWRREGHHQGGWLLDSGVHAVAAFRQVALAEVTTVQAVTRSILPDLFGGQPDTLLATVELADGAAGRLALSFSSSSRWTNAMHVYGTGGTLALLQQRREGEGRARYDDWIEVEAEGRRDVIPLEDSAGGIVQELADFHRALTTGSPPLGTAWEAAKDLQIIDAALAAAEMGTTIAIPAEIDAPWRHRTRPDPPACP
ncbi:MAG: Gfo/Idh/MocA family oxidoreductase [Chloroflexota bacterium]|nr:Gfo/Idh/MocA family oxidoreductase [Dehalococcoidia bacterium]MDW8255250.1 Gfo/Idh/MocA family oxidoreductase [Chloroflexota bacterium]